MLRHLMAPAKVMAHNNTEVRVEEKEEQSEQLIAMLGQPFDNKKIRQALGSLGVKRVPSPDGTMSEDIVWIPKASVRIDVYRAQKLSALTGTDYPDHDGCLIGAVQFLAPGSDDRIKMPFPRSLPMGLAMSSRPQDCIDTHGQPYLDEEHERPGFSGRILAWRKQGMSIAITFAGKGRKSTMINQTVCLIGCIGAWRYTNPEVFAP